LTINTALFKWIELLTIGMDRLSEPFYMYANSATRTKTAVDRARSGKRHTRGKLLGNPGYRERRSGIGNCQGQLARLDIA
jgi:hypothetical protein